MKGTLIVMAISATLVALSVFAPGVILGLFGLFELALGWAGPIVVVTVISALVGVLFILSFPHVSSQKGIIWVKSQISCNILAIRLFADNLPVVLKSLGKTLTFNFGYIGLNILPMFVMAAPFMAVWFALNSMYAFEPLPAGQETLLVAELAPGTDASKVQIVLPQTADGKPAFEITSRASLNDSERVLLVGLKPQAVGDFELAFTYAGNTLTKDIRVGGDLGGLARVKTADPYGDFADQKDPLVWFGEPAFASTDFLQSVTVDYGQMSFGLLGDGEIGIMMLFVVVSLGVGFALKNKMGVVI